MNPRNLDEIRKDIVFSAHLRGRKFSFKSTWGLFSPTEIDEGSKLLLEHMPAIQPADHILDLGCGYGALGIPLAAEAMQGEMHMVDKDFVAIDYAKKNVALNHLSNCKTYLSNGFDQVPHDAMFDVIVSNLPAKSGKELYNLMFHDAWHHLKPGGKLYVVTISGLREYIKRIFNEIFGNYDKVKQGRIYTVSLAVKSEEKHEH